MCIRDRTIASYESRIAELHGKYEQKLAAKIKEESDKLRQELTSSFKDEETIRLKKVLAAKEDQIISQLRVEIAEKLKRQIYSQECSRAYDNLRNQLIAQIKSQLESEYKRKLAMEIQKFQQESNTQMQDNISRIKQECEDKLSKRTETLYMESILQTERDREQIQREYKQ
eukprot:TRINITY_DN12808_c0_g1_i2.p1 TRINITY_DN12808_c0_g1~~TRINITY_DN12808_c0_g1_i2.p1  ORF type:complete len:171 (-),score=36.71 TRINITY_DN12808_c0_g1_i2:302-814(-)